MVSLLAAGVSGFEGREVFSRWFGVVIFKYSLGGLSWGHSDASCHFFRSEVSHLDRCTLQSLFLFSHRRVYLHSVEGDGWPPPDRISYYLLGGSGGGA
jgi:hypothetical protein